MVLGTETGSHPFEYGGAMHIVGSTASEDIDMLAQMEAAADHLRGEKTQYDAYRLA